MMNLYDALDDTNNVSGGTNQSQGQWPGGNQQPQGGWPGGNQQPQGGWPGSGGGNSVWPGQPPNPSSNSGGSSWPQGPGNNPGSSWPQGPGNNPGSSWPSGPGNNPGSSWPSGPGNNPGPQGPQGPQGPPGPGGWSNPPTAPASTPGFPPQQNLKVPYSHKLPQGLHDKRLITIEGTINAQANKFTMDVNSGKNLAFHLNPRFNDCGKKVIVCNSRIDNRWGSEERSGVFPFTPGRRFEMKILCTNNEFKVAVDGNHLFEFKHRVRNLRSIDSFCIHGDVTLSKVLDEKLP